jgi:hypothetical protein
MLAPHPEFLQQLLACTFVTSLCDTNPQLCGNTPVFFCNQYVQRGLLIMKQVLLRVAADETVHVLELLARLKSQERKLHATLQHMPPHEAHHVRLALDAVRTAIRDMQERFRPELLIAC